LKLQWERTGWPGLSLSLAAPNAVVGRLFWEMKV